MRKCQVGLFLLLVSLASAFSVYPVQPVRAQSATFAMTASPSSLSFPTGSFGISIITITSQNGFSGTINLSGESYPYQQVKVTINSSVVLPANGVVHAVANVSATTTTTPYNYTIDVNGLGPSGIQTAFLSALVTPGPATLPDFRLTANPDSLAIAPGTVRTAIISVASLDGFNADISFRVFFPPNQLNASLVHLRPSSVVNLTLTIPVSCPVSPAGTLPGRITLDANSSSLHHWLDVMVLVATSTPSFCFTPNPPFVKTVAGSFAETQFTIVGFESFNSTISLVPTSSFPVTILPSIISGLARSNPQWFNILVYVPPGTSPGNYTVTIKGRSGTVSWSDNLTIGSVTGPYFSLSTTQSSLTVAPGSVARASISLTGESGFNRNDVEAFGPSWTFGSKSFGPLSAPMGLSANITALSNITPYGVGVYTGGTTLLTVMVNASLVAIPGDYILVFGFSTLYSPYVTNYAIFSITVLGPTSPPAPTQFTITADPSKFTLQPGGTGTVTLTLASLNNFNGPVSLTLNSTMATLSLSTLTLSSSGTNSTTLRFVSSTSTLPGNYGVTVRAVGGSITRFATIQVTVAASPSSSPPSILGLSPPTFYGMLGVLAVVLLTATYVAVTRHRGSSFTVTDANLSQTKQPIREARGGMVLSLGFGGPGGI